MFALRIHTKSISNPPKTRGPDKENIPTSSDPPSPRLVTAAAVLKKARGSIVRRLSGGVSSRTVARMNVASVSLPQQAQGPRASRTPYFFGSVRPRTYLLRGVHLPAFGVCGPAPLNYAGNESLPPPTEETFAERWARMPAGEPAYRAPWPEEMDPLLAEAPVRHPCVCRRSLALLEPTQLGLEFYLWYIQRWTTYRAGRGEVGFFERYYSQEQRIRAELDVEACFGIFRTLKEDRRAPRITPVDFSIAERFLGGESLVIQLAVLNEDEGLELSRSPRMPACIGNVQ